MYFLRYRLEIVSEYDQELFNILSFAKITIGICYLWENCHFIVFICHEVDEKSSKMKISEMLQVQQFFQEKLNAIRLFYTVKDQLMNGTNKIVLKQRHTSKVTRNRATRI